MYEKVQRLGASHRINLLTIKIKSEMENNKYEYIVYCTTNKINRFIYIGVHQTLDHTKFDGYIGCGVYINQPSTYSKPETRFQAAVKKYGPDNFIRTIIKVFKNEADAYMLEEEIVNKDFLKRSDVYNMVLGGKGGGLLNAHKTYQYSITGEFIAEHESIKAAALAVDRNMRTIWRAIHEKLKSANCFWSDKKYDVLDLTYYKTEEVPKGINIFQYSATGEYECCFESIRACARCNNLPDVAIGEAMKLGRKYGNKYFLSEYAPSFDKAKVEKIKNTTVYQYSLNGEFIQEWESANKANKVLGFKSNIYTCMRLGKQAGGFLWTREKVDKLEPYKAKTGTKRKVGKFDNDWNLLETFESAAECKKAVGSGVAHVLQGRDEFHKGFHYKYLD